MSCTNDTICQIFSLFGNGIVLAFGGSSVMLGLLIMVVIGLFCWRYNVKLGTSFFFVFMAISVLKIYVNDTSFSDVGLFGTLYNLMLLGVGLVLVKTVVSELS